MPTARTLGHNAVVANKNHLISTIPMENNRYLILSETKEMYYDDGTTRFKIRDIQIVTLIADLAASKAFAYDLFFVLEDLSFYIYDGVSFTNISYNSVINQIVQGSTKAVTSGAVYDGLAEKNNDVSLSVSNGKLCITYEIDVEDDN